MLRTGWNYLDLQVCPPEHYAVIVQQVEEEIRRATSGR
jgi:hypothetical protein